MLEGQVPFMTHGFSGNPLLVKIWATQEKDQTILNTTCFILTSFSRSKGFLMVTCWETGDIRVCGTWWPPILTLITRAERKYNIAHSSTRVRIEMTFGVIKAQFACLRVRPEWACEVVVACTVLHNIAQHPKERTACHQPMPTNIVDPITLDHLSGRAVSHHNTIFLIKKTPQTTFKSCISLFI